MTRHSPVEILQRFAELANKNCRLDELSPEQILEDPTDWPHYVEAVSCYLLMAFALMLTPEGHRNYDSAQQALHKSFQLIEQAMSGDGDSAGAVNKPMTIQFPTGRSRRVNKPSNN